jgi:hypothetical protein
VRISLPPEEAKRRAGPTSASNFGFPSAGVNRKTRPGSRQMRAKSLFSRKIFGASGYHEPNHRFAERPFRIRTWRPV